MTSKTKHHQTNVSITVLSASAIHDGKLFGAMSPCATVSIPGDQSERQIIPPSIHGGTDPKWSAGATVEFLVNDDVLRVNPAPESNLPTSSRPFPHATVELFSSTSLRKSLGAATVPLEPAIRRYDEAHVDKYPVYRAGSDGRAKHQGWVQVRVTVDRASFAPEKGSPEYALFANPPSSSGSGSGSGAGSSSISGAAGIHSGAAFLPAHYTQTPPVPGVPISAPSNGHQPQPPYQGHPAPAPHGYAYPGPYANQYPYPYPYPYPPNPAPAYSGGHRHTKVVHKGRRGPGMGAGLLAGALGGLVLADVMDGGLFDGGFDVGF